MFGWLYAYVVGTDNSEMKFLLFEFSEHLINDIFGIVAMLYIQRMWSAFIVSCLLLFHSAVILVPRNLHFGAKLENCLAVLNSVLFEQYPLVWLPRYAGAMVARHANSTSKCGTHSHLQQLQQIRRNEQNFNFHMCSHGTKWRQKTNGRNVYKTVCLEFVLHYICWCILALFSFAYVLFWKRLLAFHSNWIRSRIICFAFFFAPFWSLATNTPKKKHDQYKIRRYRFVTWIATIY